MGRLSQPHNVLANERSCERCGAGRQDFRRLPREAFTYLLGLYLGDGCLFTNKRVTSLRVSMDTAYPWVILSCADAIEDVRVGCGREVARLDAFVGPKC